MNDTLNRETEHVYETPLSAEAADIADLIQGEAVEISESTREYFGAFDIRCSGARTS